MTQSMNMHAYTVRYTVCISWIFRSTLYIYSLLSTLYSLLERLLYSESIYSRFEIGDQYLEIGVSMCA